MVFAQKQKAKKIIKTFLDHGQLRRQVKEFVSTHINKEIGKIFLYYETLTAF